MSCVVLSNKGSQSSPKHDPAPRLLPSELLDPLKYKRSSLFPSFFSSPLNSHLALREERISSLEKAHL